MKIELAKDTISNEDIDALREWLKDYPRLTKGPLTIEFEDKWAETIGTDFATFVNSGSSAILMALQALIENGELAKGDKVVVPALSWATNYSSVSILGLEPILCDCEMVNLGIDPNHFETIARVYQPRVVFLVSVLGLVPEMKAILDICDRYNIILVEDACESIGSWHGKRQLGTFGRMSLFSTYFGHHISTVEGGMICTNDPKLDEILKCIRNHGWNRDLSPDRQKEMQQAHNIPDFDSLYTFYHLGFNFRATDIQAFLGLRQLKILQDICDIRFSNYKHYSNLFRHADKYWTPPKNGGYPNHISNFAYPLIFHNKTDRDAVVRTLEAEDIGVRPLICGSISRQPFFKFNQFYQNTPNADGIHDTGLYLPNHAHISCQQIIHIVKQVHIGLGLEES